MRDVVLADTIYMMFTTRAFATGIPTVLAGTPVVSAYENDSATQITAGITLGVSHDSVVGMNLLTIVATGANGYEADKDYNLVITTGTVGGVSVVGEVVGQFSIQRAPVNWANVADPTTALDLSGTDIQLVDTVTTYTGNTPQTADHTAGIADVPTVAEFNARTLVAASYFDPAADTVATVTTLTNLPAITANWLTAAGIAASAMDNKGNWNIGKTGYALTTADWNVGKTGYSLTATTGLGAQTANITGNLSGSVGSVTGSVGSNLELGPAEVNAECDTAISDAALATATNLATVDTNVDNLNLGIIYGVTEAGTLSTTVATTDLAGYADDELIGGVIVFTGGDANGQRSAIEDYASTNGTVTYAAITTLPAAGDPFKIV